jgi:hypothetical protein
MPPIDTDDIFVLGFYIITTMLQLYFLWNISELLRNLVQDKRRQ